MKANNDKAISLTPYQLSQVIELLEKEHNATGKAFFLGLTDNIKEQTNYQKSTT